MRRVNSYNHAMPIAAPRRVGVAGLLGLLAGALVLMLAPGNPGALRLAGIGLLWWYAAVVAPLAAVLLVIVVQRVSPGPASRRPRVLAVAAWTSPVLLALVASRVFSGMPDAPSLALSALVAPLIALLAPASSAERRPNLVAVLTAVVGAGLVLWANLLLFGDVAGLFGLPRLGRHASSDVIALLAVELAHTADAPRRAVRLEKAGRGARGRASIGWRFVAVASHCSTRARSASSRWSRSSRSRSPSRRGGPGARSRRGPRSPSARRVHG